MVAANKKPLALSLERRAAVSEVARRHFRAWHYETTVGAGLPVIETLRNLVATGDVVERIDGSLSGTLGFLCQEVMAGSPLSVAVRQARDRGYTDQPHDDLSGLDVARKALILARELGLPLELDDVAVEPFVDASLLAEEDPERFLLSLASHDEAFGLHIARYAAAGRTLRYLVRIVPGAEGRKVRVGPRGGGAGAPRGAAPGRGGPGRLHHRPLPRLPAHRPRRRRRRRRHGRGRARRRVAPHPERPGPPIAPLGQGGLGPADM